jgi:hypothetical protein
MLNVSSAENLTRLQREFCVPEVKKKNNIKKSEIESEQTL